MALINTRDNQKIIDYLARDYDSFRDALVSLIPSKLPEWTDRSEADFGIVLIELASYMADILSYYQDRVANEAFLATAQERRSVIQHLRLIGYEMAGAAPASAYLSILAPATETRIVEVRPGDQFATKSGADQPSQTFEYTDGKPLVINFQNVPLSRFENKKEAAAVIPVREGKTIRREVIGISDGSPNQRFPLSQPGVLRSTVQIVADTNPPTAPWRLRKNFIFGRRAFTPLQLAALEQQERITSSLAFSRAADPDFGLETDEHEITTAMFGDGEFGLIPPTGAPLLATYRAGGGAAGNVGAGLINIISDAPQLQSFGASVVNRAPASGGAPRESVEHAVRFAPSVFVSMGRAVTAEDYVAQALLFPGVSKARAVSRNWNTIELFIAPHGQGEEPSDILRRDLLAYFEDKRMLTTQIRISSPKYVALVLEVEIGAQPFFRNAEVEASARATIRNLFDFEKTEFGQTFYLSKIFEALEALDGVDFADVKAFRRAGPAGVGDSTGRIKFADDEIGVLASADLTLTVNGGIVGETAS